jgi:hypothetical protein
MLKVVAATLFQIVRLFVLRAFSQIFNTGGKTWRFLNKPYKTHGSELPVDVSVNEHPTAIEENAQRTFGFEAVGVQVTDTKRGKPTT